MKSKSQIKTPFSADSPTLGIKRLNEPPSITQASCIGQSGISIGNRPFMTYAVLDAFNLSCGIKNCTAILCREANVDLLSMPGVEPIACFVPVPGRGSYAQDLVRPSILFWRDDFWIPLWTMSPQREEIAKHMYGGDILNDHTFDVLHPVKVDNIPDVDLLKIKDPELD